MKLVTCFHRPGRSELRSSQLTSTAIPVLLHKRTPQLTSSNQPIACLSDQQAGHVTHRTPSVSKYSSQGLSQQLSNLPAGTSYTALYTCFNYWLQSVPAGTSYTALYTCLNNCLQSVPTGTGLHSLVHLLQQLVTECPAGTGYTALYTYFNNWLQSVPTGTAYTVLYTCFNLPVTKSTNRVLATQSLLYRASPQLVTKKKKKKPKKKLAKYRPVAV